MKEFDELLKEQDEFLEEYQRGLQRYRGNIEMINSLIARLRKRDGKNEGEEDGRKNKE